jgi:tol-pal system protein YbgF
MRSTQNNCRLRKAWLVPGLLAMGAGLFLLPSPVFAQSSDIMNRLGRIENEIQTLSRSVYRGEAPPPGAFAGDTAAQAQTEIRLQQLESDLREIRGRIEEQNYQLRQMQDKLDRALSDMEMRMGDVEKRASAAPPPSARYAAGSQSKPPPAVQTGSAYQPEEGQLGTLSQMETSSGDPAAMKYESAFSLLKNAQYDEAAKNFHEFISSYPNHSLISNAKYWLGETYYVRGQFADAARVFAEGYQQAPAGAKAPDNLLKLGMSLAGMGNKDDACVALDQIGKEFSKGSTPVLRRAEQEKGRLGCSG